MVIGNDPAKLIQIDATLSPIHPGLPTSGCIQAVNANALEPQGSHLVVKVSAETCKWRRSPGRQVQQRRVVISGDTDCRQLKTVHPIQSLFKFFLLSPLCQIAGYNQRINAGFPNESCRRLERGTIFPSEVQICKVCDPHAPAPATRTQAASGM